MSFYFQKRAFPILNWIQQSSEDAIPKNPEEKQNTQKTIYVFPKTLILGLMLSQNKRVTEQFHDILKFPPGVLMSW